MNTYSTTSDLSQNPTLEDNDFEGLGQVVKDSKGYYFLPYDSTHEVSPYTLTPELPSWVKPSWILSTAEWCDLHASLRAPKPYHHITAA